MKRLFVPLMLLFIFAAPGCGNNNDEDSAGIQAQSCGTLKSEISMFEANEAITSGGPISFQRYLSVSATTGSILSLSQQANQISLSINSTLLTSLSSSVQSRSSFCQENFAITMYEDSGQVSAGSNAGYIFLRDQSVTSQVGTPARATVHYDGTFLYIEVVGTQINRATGTTYRVNTRAKISSVTYPITL